MEKSAPTRLKLLSLKSQHDVIKKGLELLKSKREALMKEFFGEVEQSVAMRERAGELMSRGQRRVTVAKALYGEGELSSFIHSAHRDVSLDIKVRNIWGVKVPEIEDTALTRTFEARDLSPVGEKAIFFQVARDFETASDLLVKIASKEIKLSRIGEMIKADTRKINAITEVILPSLRKLIKTIEGTLEEREREEVFRLKRFKRARSVKSAEAKGRPAKKPPARSATGLE